jgi:hypothetical protein
LCREWIVGHFPELLPVQLMPFYQSEPFHVPGQILVFASLAAPTLIGAGRAPSRD